jgi:hypothetical protein
MVNTAMRTARGFAILITLYHYSIVYHCRRTTMKFRLLHT